mmetsp:Transcript_4098/g.25813  ORF Transcript_4098/g.25813 Transcript_4098/m.25813 type:complete len:223 (-) Transcript_4098:1391-2059(-)
MLNQNRRSYPYLTIHSIRSRFEEITPQTNLHLQADHKALPQRINGRVGNLGKSLFEVVVHQVRLFRHESQRNIIPHAKCCFTALCGHCLDHHLHIFCTVAIRTAAAEKLCLVHGRLGKVFKLDKVIQCPQTPCPLVPLFVRLLICNTVRSSNWVKKFTSFQVNNHHFARSQTSLVDDIWGRLEHIIKHASFRSYIDSTITGFPKPSRAQSIAIQPCPNCLSV